MSFNKRDFKCSSQCKNPICFCFINEWKSAKKKDSNNMGLSASESVCDELHLTSERNLSYKICERVRNELITSFWLNLSGKWCILPLKLNPLDMWNEGLNLIINKMLQELQMIIGEIYELSSIQHSDAEKYQQQSENLIIPSEFSLRSRLCECGHCLHDLCKYFSMSQKNFDHLIKLNLSLSNKLQENQKNIDSSNMKIMEIEPCSECPRYQKLLQESKDQLDEISRKYIRSNSEKEKVVMKYATGEKNLIVAQKSLQALEKKNKITVEENSSLKSHVNKLQDSIVQLSKNLRAKDSEILRLKNLNKLHENTCQKSDCHKTNALLASPRKVDELKDSKKQWVNIQTQTEPSISHAQDEETQTEPLISDFSIASDSDDLKADQTTELETSPKMDEKELELELEKLKKREADLLDFVQKLIDKNVELVQSIVDCKEELRRAKDHTESLTGEIGKLSSDNNKLQNTLLTQMEDSEILADYVAQQLNLNQRLLHEVEELNGANSILQHRCKSASRRTVHESGLSSQE